MYSDEEIPDRTAVINDNLNISNIIPDIPKSNKNNRNLKQRKMRTHLPNEKDEVFYPEF